jgi:hypothetical protein
MRRTGPRNTQGGKNATSRIADNVIQALEPKASVVLAEKALQAICKHSTLSTRHAEIVRIAANRRIHRCIAHEELRRVTHELTGNGMDIAWSFVGCPQAFGLISRHVAESLLYAWSGSTFHNKTRVAMPILRTGNDP